MQTFAAAGPATANRDLTAAQQLIDDGWADDAEELLNDLLKSDSDNPEVYYLLARVYLERDSYQSSNGGAPWDNLNHIEEYAKKAIELNSSEAKYYVVLGHGVGLKALRGGTVKKFSRAKSAKASYETAVELDPNYFEARTSLIEYHMQAPGIAGGDKEEARRHAQAIAEIDSAEGFHAWKTVYLYKKDYDALEASIKEVIVARPADKEGYAEFAWLCRRRQDYDCAREYIDKVLAIDPEDTEIRWYLSRIYVNEERYDEAKAVLEQAIEVAPAKPYVYRWLGDFCQERERWDEAIEWYEKTLEVDPAYARAIYKMGETYVLADENLDRAEECFKQYMNSRLKCWWPERAMAHCELAKIYLLRGDRKTAVAEIKKAKKLNPNNDEIQKVAKKLRVR
jgi:tetratricopeptide (TPR) repeat protein